MPNMEELLNEISAQLLISKNDLYYANEQMKLSEETSRQSVFAITGENVADTTDSKNSFTVLPTYPRYFKKKLTVHSDTAYQLG